MSVSFFIFLLPICLNFVFLTAFKVEYYYNKNYLILYKLRMIIKSIHYFFTS